MLRTLEQRCSTVTGFNVPSENGREGKDGSLGNSGFLGVNIPCRAGQGTHYDAVSMLWGHLIFLIHLASGATTGKM